MGVEFAGKGVDGGEGVDSERGDGEGRAKDGRGGERGGELSGRACLMSGRSVVLSLPVD